MKLNQKDVRFAGHETFAPRYGWLKKGYDFVKNGQHPFGHDEAPVVLGVGKNMVKSIAYWCEAYGIIRKPNKDDETAPNCTGYLIDPFWEQVFDEEGYDPYLEDPASLWLLHYFISTNERKATTFSWAFNHCGLNEFNSEYFIAELKFFYGLRGINIKDASIKKDFQILRSTYDVGRMTGDDTSLNQLESPFSQLSLIVPSMQSGQLRFNIGKKNNLPLEWVVYAIFRQFEIKTEAIKKSNPELKDDPTWKGAQELSFDELLHGKGSPGAVFKLDSESLYQMLNKSLEAKLLANCSYTEDAGIHTLRKLNACDDALELLLGSYYEGALS